MGSPPGSPYAVDLGLMITTMFSAMSPARLLRFKDNLLHSIEQTTSDPNAVGVRRRHALPGLWLFLSD